MWTSPKYQTRIATDRQAADHRLAAVDRRAAVAHDPSDEGGRSTVSSPRDRILSFPVFRFRRV
jgi:hypothetical protein